MQGLWGRQRRPGFKGFRRFKGFRGFRGWWYRPRGRCAARVQRVQRVQKVQRGRYRLAAMNMNTALRAFLPALLVILRRRQRILVFAVVSQTSPLVHQLTSSLFYSFGTGPYLFFFFSPGKKARSTTAIMKITATTLVAMSSLPRNCPPSWLMAKRMRKKAQ